MIISILSINTANAVTDYTTPEKREDSGEYKSVHDDITTVGQKERIPTWNQVEENRKKDLEQKTEPVKPDITEDNQKLYTEDATTVK